MLAHLGLQTVQPQPWHGAVGAGAGCCCPRPTLGRVLGGTQEVARAGERLTVPAACLGPPREGVGYGTLAPTVPTAAPGECRGLLLPPRGLSMPQNEDPRGGGLRAAREGQWWGEGGRQGQV